MFKNISTKQVLLQGLLLSALILMLLGIRPAAHSQPPLPNKVTQPPNRAQLRFRRPDPNLKDVGIVISPVVINQKALPGQDDKVSITIENRNSVSDVHVEFKMISFLPTEQGWPYNEVDNHEHNASNWFKSPIAPLNIRKGSSVNVQLPFKVPSNARGCWWAATVMDISFLKANDLKPVIGNIHSPVGMFCYVPIIISAGVTRKATLNVSPLKVNRIQAKGDNYSLDTLVVNDTEGFSDIATIVEIKNNMTNRIVWKEILANKYVLPRSRRVHSIQLPRLSDGVYTATLRIVQDGIRLQPLATNFAVAGKTISEKTDAMLLRFVPIGLEPVTVELAMKPASEASKIITVSNNSNNPISLEITPCGINQRTDGFYDTDPSISPQGLVLSVFPQSFELPPNKTANVRLKVTATRQAQGDIWFGLRVREKNGKSDPQSVVGHALVGTKANPVLSLEQGKMDAVNGYPTAYHFKIYNRGDLAVIPDIRANVQQRTGARSVPIEVPVFEWNGMGILPGFVLESQVSIPPNLKPGEYALRIEAQYQEQKPFLLQNFIVKSSGQTQSKSTPSPSSKGKGSKPKP